MQKTTLETKSVLPCESSGILAATTSKAWITWYPPPVLLVSEWADEHRYLSPEASAEPGKWRNDRAPHLVAPMDALSSLDPCRRVVCKFSSQTGKTEITLNFIGYIITQDPGPTLAIQPNVKPMGEAYSKDRIAPLIRDCPVIKAKVSPGKGKDSANTINHKTFPGGHLTIGGANSPAGLASRPIRYFIGDEFDRWEVTKEGSSLLLARKRQIAFHNRKELLVSSPTYSNVGIDAEYKKADQNWQWELSCRECGDSQFPRLKHFIWEKDYRKAAYACEHCGVAHPIEQEDRIKSRGTWVCTKNNGIASKGYWMNQWGSPFARWVDTLEEFILAKDDKDALQVVTNTAFAETFDDHGEPMTNAELMDRRGDFSLTSYPDDILLLTAGVDVQKDRLECQVVGWDDRGRPWILAHVLFMGSPIKKQVWEIFDKFRMQDHGGMVIAATCIDRSYSKDAVIKYCRPLWGAVYPVRGEAGPNVRDPIGKPRTSGRPATRYIPLGVDIIKDRIQATLEDPEDIEFSDTLDEEWFDGLLSEEVRYRKSKGHTFREWHKVKRRNEPLDCLVYAWAAFLILNPALSIIKKNRLKSDEPKRQDYTPKKRKTYVNAWRR